MNLALYVRMARRRATAQVGRYTRRRGNRNGNYTKGEWTAEAIAERRWLRSLVRAFAKMEAADEQEA